MSLPALVLAANTLDVNSILCSHLSPCLSTAGTDMDYTLVQSRQIEVICFKA